MNEKHRKLNFPALMGFDKVNSNKLWEVRTDKSVLQHLVTVIQRLYLDTKISTNSKLSEAEKQHQ